MKRNAISLFLLVGMICGLISLGTMPASAYSETDIPYAVVGGNIYFDAATGKVTGSDASVTDAAIPSEINGVSVTSIGAFSFRDCSNLETVLIPESVITIGDSAFAGCSGLTNVTIPDSVETIGKSAFLGCSGLNSVTIGDGVTSLSDHAFNDCSNLTKIEFGNNLIHIGYCAFSDCGFTSITLPEGVAHIGNHAFWRCVNLANVSLPDSLRVIDAGAFEWCHSLNDIGIPQGVNRIGGGAFYDTAYYNDKSNWQNGVLYLDQWLIDAEEELSGPYEVLAGTVGIADNVFQWCGLTSVTIPSSVISVGECSFETSSLTGIWVDAGNEYFSNDEHGFLFNKDMTALIRCPGGYSGSYVIPKGVANIGFRAFALCDGLTAVTIPDSVTNIGTSAFYCCYNLTGAYFKGDAPALGDFAFCVYTYGGSYPNEDLTLYYVEGKEGWTSPTWNGYPTAIWEPPHEHEYTTVVTEATCTEQGYTTYTCACGESYVSGKVAALGHDYNTGNCTRCGEADPDYVPEVPVIPVDFSDVPSGVWYSDAVEFAVSNGLMNGTGNNRFEPESSMTRAMLVTVLWRYAGESLDGENHFSDVQDGLWYSEAVAWAAHKGIVGGVGNGKFDPDGKITREQLAVILYRYCNSNGIDTSEKAELQSFPDENTVSTWAIDALSWAVAEGLVTGSREGNMVYLNPLSSATRAQVAAILMRFMNNVVT